MKNLCKQILLILVLVSTASYGTTYVHLNDNMHSINLTGSSDIFIDHSSALTFDDIKNQHDIQWSQFSKPNLGYTHAAVWLKLKLLSLSSVQKKWILYFEYPIIERIDVWLDRNGKTEHFTIGLDTSHANVSTMPKAIFLPFDMHPSESTVIYLRVTTSTSMDLSSSIVDPIYFSQITSTKTKWNFLYFGLLLAMALYNAFLIKFVRDKTYAFYAVYVLTYLLSTMALSGDLQYLLAGFEISTSKQIIPFFIGSTSLWFVLFSQQFLQLKLYSKKMNYYAYFVTFASCLTIALSFFASFRVSMNVGISVSLLPMPISLFSIYCYRKGYHAARFYLISFSVLLIGQLIAHLQRNAIIPTNGINTLLLSASIQAILLALALGDKIHKEQTAAQKTINNLNRNLEKEHLTLLQLNENLEKRVQDKTREVRRLLDHIPHGIFSIESDMRVSETFSAYLPLIFETTEIGGSLFHDVFVNNSDISNDKRDRLVQSLIASIGEEPLVFELNSGNLPSELTYICPSGKRKYLDVTWHHDTDIDGKVSRFLVSLRDVSESHIMRYEIEKQQNEMLLTKELIICGENNFKRFMETSIPLLSEIEEATRSQNFDRETLKLMFANAHTIKGSARTLGLNEVASVIHNAEQYYSDILKKGVPLLIERIKSDVEMIKNMLSACATINRVTLNRQSGLETVPVSKNFLIEHCNILIRFGDQKSASESEKYESLVRGSVLNLISILHPSLCQILDESFNQVDRIAKDLDKPSPKVIIKSDNAYIKESIEGTLRNIAIHILRNALDHGIESPEERLKSGKPERGQINVTATIGEQDLEIDVRDDGRGLLIDKLRTKGLETGVIKSHAAVEEVAESIFESGISTAEVVSDISGRGVGMDAVKRFVEDRGGGIKLLLLNKINASSENYSFAIKITFPKDCFIDV